jgi:adenylyltransferase/sulfurtransferase
MPVLPEETACLACVYPDPPSGAQPTCETAGVIGTITALIASLQVTAAIQILAGKAADVPRKLTTVDIWTGVIRQLPQPERDPECRVCAQHEYRYLDGHMRKPISLCGRNAVQIHERSRPVRLNELAEQLRPLGEVRVNEFALRFFIPPHEMTVFPDGRAIIKGTTDPGIARSLYSRYIGA